MNLSRYTNPRMTGVVVKEAVKCGKENCHCSRGNLHKWYYYLYYRSFENDKWKLKKQYNHVGDYTGRRFLGVYKIVLFEVFRSFLYCLNCSLIEFLLLHTLSKARWLGCNSSKSILG